MDTISPIDCESHQDHPDIVRDNSKSKVVSEKPRHREEIAPVVCLFAHPPNQRKRSSTRIRYIKRDIREILSEPPESYACSKWIVLSKQEHISDQEWHQALCQAPTEYPDELSKWREYHMACLMEYQIGSMEKITHDSQIDLQCKKTK